MTLVQSRPARSNGSSMLEFNSRIFETQTVSLRQMDRFQRARKLTVGASRLTRAAPEFYLSGAKGLRVI